MTIVVDETPKAAIQTLLDGEGLESVGLLIRQHPGDPDQFDFGVSDLAGNIDVSPTGLSVFIEPAADKAGTYRLTHSAGTISLAVEP